MQALVARRLSVLGFALASVALVIVGWTSYGRLADLRESSRLVDHTLQVRTELERVLALLTDAETGQRGFLITGVAAYLEPYTIASASLPPYLDQLRRLTGDNPTQQRSLASLDGLIQEKLAELNATITAREGQGRAAANRIVLTDAGKLVMDRIRAIIAAMRAEEERLLSERAAREAHDARVLITAEGGLALAVLFILAATMLLNNAVRARGRAAADRMAAEAVAAAVTESAERLRVTLRSIGDAVIATDPWDA